MTTGAITGNIDIAQMVLYAFWLFFAGLIWYLRREDKREGYPLEEPDGSPHTLTEGFPGRPNPKIFTLAHGGIRIAPVEWQPGDREVPNSRPVAAHPGAPIEPTGNAMLSGIGPGSWAHRSDELDLTIDGLPKIVPLRSDSSYSIDPRDPDPRGHKVFGGDGEPGGTVRDLWVDRSERLFRYVEVEVGSEDGPRQVLLPINFSKIAADGSIKVDAIFGKHFADVPGLRNADQVTMLEEEKVVAYYGAGKLYAAPSRLGPLL
ncbi:MAG: photosynthetic reaction center subunit H [Nevskia sp.]